MLPNTLCLGQSGSCLEWWLQSGLPYDGSKSGYFPVRLGAEKFGRETLGESFLELGTQWGQQLLLTWINQGIHYSTRVHCLNHCQGSREEILICWSLTHLQWQCQAPSKTRMFRQQQEPGVGKGPQSGPEPLGSSARALCCSLVSSRVWDGLQSGWVQGKTFPRGQPRSREFLPLNSAIDINNSHSMPAISFSALLKETSLLYNNSRIFQWAEGRRISSGTKYHFLHLSFNTAIAE